MKDWRSLGTAHRRRDEAAEGIAQGRADFEGTASATALARWSGIVPAIRAVVAAYNEGAGRERLVVTETADGAPPAVTIEAPGSGIPALVVRLDGAELNVGSQSTDAHTGGMKRWVDLTRTDDETAAYVLQEWIERL